MIKLALDDELYRLAQEVAAAEGKTVDEFVGKVLREALSSHIRRTVHNGLPIMVLSDPAFTIDPNKIHRSIEEDGF